MWNRSCYVFGPQQQQAPNDLDLEPIQRSKTILNVFLAKKAIFIQQRFK